MDDELDGDRHNVVVRNGKEGGLGVHQRFRPSLGMCGTKMTVGFSPMLYCTIVDDTVNQKPNRNLE